VEASGKVHSPGAQASQSRQIPPTAVVATNCKGVGECVQPFLTDVTIFSLDGRSNEGVMLIVEMFFKILYRDEDMLAERTELAFGESVCWQRREIKSK